MTAEIVTIRNKVTEKQAVRLTEENEAEVLEWVRSFLQASGTAFSSVYHSEGRGIIIPTPEGAMTASYGDWVVRGLKNEAYPVKPDIFEQSYDIV